MNSRSLGKGKLQTLPKSHRSRSKYLSSYQIQRGRKRRSLDKRKRERQYERRAKKNKSLKYRKPISSEVWESVMMRNKHEVTATQGNAGTCYIASEWMLLSKSGLFDMKLHPTFADQLLQPLCVSNETESLGESIQGIVFGNSNLPLKEQIPFFIHKTFDYPRNLTTLINAITQNGKYLPEETAFHNFSRIMDKRIHWDNSDPLYIETVNKEAKDGGIKDVMECLHSRWFNQTSNTKYNLGTDNSSMEHVLLYHDLKKGGLPDDMISERLDNLIVNRVGMEPSEYRDNYNRYLKLVKDSDLDLMYATKNPLRLISKKEPLGYSFPQILGMLKLHDFNLVFGHLSDLSDLTDNTLSWTYYKRYLHDTNRDDMEWEYNTNIEVVRNQYSIPDDFWGVLRFRPETVDGDYYIDWHRKYNHFMSTFVEETTDDYGRPKRQATPKIPNNYYVEDELGRKQYFNLSPALKRRLIGGVICIGTWRYDDKKQKGVGHSVSFLYNRDDDSILYSNTHDDLPTRELRFDHRGFYYRSYLLIAPETYMYEMDKWMTSLDNQNSLFGRVYNSVMYGLNAQNSTQSDDEYEYI